MRFPLSMTAGLAGYIAKNKWRPRPEWQEDRSGEVDASNPFRILHAVARRAEQGRTASDDQQAVSAGADAGAAARLQPDLHRLRADSRVRDHDHRATAAGSSAWQRWTSAARPIVSICGGEPLLYPDIGELVTRMLERGKHIYLCTNGMFMRKRREGVHAEPAAASSTSTWTAWRRITTWRWSAKACSTRRSKASRSPRRRASRSAPTPRSTKRPT